MKAWLKRAFWSVACLLLASAALPRPSKPTKQETATAHIVKAATFGTKLIHTEPGAGYVLRCSEQRQATRP